MLRHSLGFRLFLINILLLILSAPIYLLVMTEWEKKIVFSADVTSLVDFAAIQATFFEENFKEGLCLLEMVDQLAAHKNDAAILASHVFSSLPGHISTSQAPNTTSTKKRMQIVATANPSIFLLRFTGEHYQLTLTQDIFPLQKKIEQEVLVSSNAYLRTLTLHSSLQLLPQNRAKEALVDTRPLSEISQYAFIKVLGDEEFLLISIPMQYGLEVQLYTPVKFITPDSQKEIRFFLGFFFLIICVSGALTFYISQKMTHPLSLLFDTMHKVGQGDLDARYCITRWAGEINEIGEKLNEVTSNLQAEISIASRERGDRELLLKELGLARTIQQRLFPETHMKTNYIDITSKALTIQDVSGLFCEIYERPAKDPTLAPTLFLMFGESVAAGISACIATFDLRSILRSYAFEHEDLHEVMSKSNHLFYQDVQTSGLFATTFALSFNPITKKLRYSSAGHCPAVWVRAKDGACIPLFTHGVAMGLFQHNFLTPNEILLEAGDLIFLYSETLLLLEDHNKASYGETRLFDLLRDNRRASSEEIINIVAADFEDFCQPLKLHRDSLVIAMKVQ